MKEKKNARMRNNGMKERERENGGQRTKKKRIINQKQRMRNEDIRITTIVEGYRGQ